MSCITDRLLNRGGCIKEKFIIYKQAQTNTHLTNTHATGNLAACSPSRGPHRHVLDKDRQIR